MLGAGVGAGAGAGAGEVHSCHCLIVDLSYHHLLSHTM